jgi:hypothetical protein
MFRSANAANTVISSRNISRQLQRYTFIIVEERLKGVEVRERGGRNKKKEEKYVVG